MNKSDGKTDMKILFYSYMCKSTFQNDERLAKIDPIVMRDWSLFYFHETVHYDDNTI